ncbi:hypothetical protein A0J61_06946 [Choanephora cucurbitarum]|uniref:Uncharacterized protein n=1 Tax=Choanephora cucurbitarum TaxID=101091 RepID=A0A1C7N795_9FUNG|nr:hypothetical protein A0J61_06946 [Choanephora cucurbitarum]
MQHFQASTLGPSNGYTKWLTSIARASPTHSVGMVIVTISTKVTRNFFGISDEQTPLKAFEDQKKGTENHYL